MTRTQAEWFFRVWMTTDTMKEAAEQLGLTERQVSNHAAYFRRNDIPLPCNKKGDHGRGQRELTKEDMQYLRELLGQIQEEMEREKRIEADRQAAEKYRRGA